MPQVVELSAALGRVNNLKTWNFLVLPPLASFSALLSVTSSNCHSLVESNTVVIRLTENPSQGSVKVDEHRKRDVIIGSVMHFDFKAGKSKRTTPADHFPATVASCYKKKPEMRASYDFATTVADTYAPNPRGVPQKLKDSEAARSHGCVSHLVSYSTKRFSRLKK
jgi:hypothetical protein